MATCPACHAFLDHQHRCRPGDIRRLRRWALVIVCAVAGGYAIATGLGGVSSPSMLGIGIVLAGSIADACIREIFLG